MFLPFYIFLYCNIDSILNKVYLSNNIPISHQSELIIETPHFYYFVRQLSIFILCAYSIFIIKTLLCRNSINKTSLSLALIYIKYVLNHIFNERMLFCEYEFSRSIMWLFSTPLILNMYCESNHLTLANLNIHYHMIPVTINILIYPFKHTHQQIYWYFVGLSYISFGLFMKTLYKYRTYLFTNILLLIWTIYMIINMIEISNLTDKYTINILYLCADMIGKMTSNIIINDYNEREENIKNRMDLQCIHFISYMLEHINKYYSDNSIITNTCNDYITYVKNQYVSKIPENKDILKKELLQKILPFGMENEYIKNENASKRYDMICILFTDIVNYTELSKKYDDKIIFKLLNDVYRTFDKIIKKYANLQKIETIGDAYMVVGDIYRHSNNHTKVIHQMILLSFEFIREIRNIDTPDNSPLSLRIGINMGKVSIGILGNEIPRLCVVGNAVNVAARLQSTADVNSIQMSRHIYEQLGEITFDESFKIITKENVFLKNIGSVNTFNIYPE